jgi:catecholate siderophore receptor
VIQERNSTTLRDVLRNVPGISMSAGEGGSGPGGDNLAIRGFNARNDVFIDNVRDFGAYSRDPFNYEQVEVVKGPASSYTGRGSTGGSINLVTKTAKLEDSFYHADLGIGTEDYKRFTVDVNQRLTGLWKNRGAAGPLDNSKIVVPPTPVDADPYFKASFRLNAMWTEGDVANRDFVSYGRWGVAPSLTLGFGDYTKLIFNYFHMQENNQPDNGLPFVTSTQTVLPRRYWNQPAPVRFSTYYGSLERDFEETTTDIGTMQFQQTVGEWLKINNTVRYGQTHRDAIITSPRFINGVTDPDVAINQEFQSRDQVDTIIAEQFDTRFSFSTFGVKHDLVTGFDLSYEMNENSLRAQTPPVLPTRLYNPDPTRNYTATYVYTGARNESNETNAALFAFDTLKFWEDRILLNGGARWDYYESQLDQRLVTGMTNRFERVDKIWSYRVALAYKPVKNGTIYVAYGTSFNPSGESAVSLTPVNAAVNALEPEKNSTWEIGTKWDLLNERLSVTAAVFRTDKTNARTPGLTPTDPLTVLEGEQRVEGFEIGVSGNITEHWKVFGGYTYLQSEILKSNTRTTVPGTTRTVSQVGNELPQTPQNTFSLWTTYSLPWQIEIGAGVNYVGDRFAGTDNLRVAPDYWTYDAMISKQFTKNIKAQINVYNLTDEEYIDRVSGGHFVPGAGRTAMLTIGLAF